MWKTINPSILPETVSSFLLHPGPQWGYRRQPDRSRPRLPCCGQQYAKCSPNQLASHCHSPCRKALLPSYSGLPLGWSRYALNPLKQSIVTFLATISLNIQIQTCSDHIAEFMSDGHTVLDWRKTQKANIKLVIGRWFSIRGLKYRRGKSKSGSVRVNILLQISTVGQ